MDYIFFATLRPAPTPQPAPVLRPALTLRPAPTLNLVVSYDIVCQWHKNLWHRMKVLPHSWHVDQGTTKVTFLVPKFHLPAHVEFCNNTFSFNLTKGVGRTDGEGPERGWDHINPMAASTKEMGPGSRRDTLDDHFGDWNWKKIVGLGARLYCTALEMELTSFQQAQVFSAKSKTLLMVDMSISSHWNSCPSRFQKRLSWSGLDSSRHGR
jgi:hypothetical protein